MLEKVLKAFEKYDMLGTASEITLGLSGGADSVCLFYVLLELKEKLNFKLSAIHINHQLRGEESDRDETFVKELCSKHQVPLKVERVDVRKRAEEKGESIELAARNIRYAIFGKIGGLIATAHTASDNLETVLYNITRGAGLKGASGIPPKRDNVIRPLIFCTREDVETYLKSKDAMFVTDSTNLEDEYTRNKLRHSVTPVLKEINPSAEAAASRMCELFREDEDFLSSFSHNIYSLVKKEDYLDVVSLRKQHASIIKRVISEFASEQFALLLDNMHLEKCLEIMMNKGKTSINKNMFAVCDGNSFSFSSGKEEKPKCFYKTELVDVSLEKINKLFSKDMIDYDKISGSIVVRERKESDSIRLNGRNCSKTLKKLFNELKIPLSERDIIPVAADNLGVIWIYGVGISERIKVDESTVCAKQFIVTKINNHKKSGDVKYDSI